MAVEYIPYKVNPSKWSSVDVHSTHVAHFIAQVFGGPPFYTGEDNGSHATMVAHHVGKHLTEQQRKRWMHLLIETADEIGLAEDAEFRSAFLAYLEWGSRIAVVNSQAIENPVSEGEPMPKWGWGEPGGPYQPWISNKISNLHSAFILYGGWIYPL